MKMIVSQFIHHIKANDETHKQSQSKATYVDNRIYLLSPEIPEGDFNIVLLKTHHKSLI